jgi:hypothetical protein
MFRKALWAAAVAVPLSLVGSMPSMADTDVNVRFGVGIGTPYYGYPVYGDNYYRSRHRLSCWQARQLVRDAGFYRVRTIECSGRVYTFRAFRRGKIVVISVNSRTGALRRS